MLLCNTEEFDGQDVCKTKRELEASLHVQANPFLLAVSWSVSYVRFLDSILAS